MERAKTVGYKLLMQLLHFAIVLIGISFLTLLIEYPHTGTIAAVITAQVDGLR